MIVLKIINYLVKLLIFIIEKIYIYKKNNLCGWGRARENQFFDGDGGSIISLDRIYGRVWVWEVGAGLSLLKYTPPRPAPLPCLDQTCPLTNQNKNINWQTKSSDTKINKDIDEYEIS